MKETHTSSSSRGGTKILVPTVTKKTFTSATTPNVDIASLGRMMKNAEKSFITRKYPKSMKIANQILDTINTSNMETKNNIESSSLKQQQQQQPKYSKNQFIQLMNTPLHLADHTNHTESTEKKKYDLCSSFSVDFSNTTSKSNCSIKNLGNRASIILLQSYYESTKNMQQQQKLQVKDPIKQESLSKENPSSYSSMLDSFLNFYVSTTTCHDNYNPMPFQVALAWVQFLYQISLNENENTTNDINNRSNRHVAVEMATELFYRGLMVTKKKCSRGNDNDGDTYVTTSKKNITSILNFNDCYDDLIWFLFTKVLPYTKDSQHVKLIFQKYLVPATTINGAISCTDPTITTITNDGDDNHVNTSLKWTSFPVQVHTSTCVNKEAVSTILSCMDEIMEGSQIQESTAPTTTSTPTIFGECRHQLQSLLILDNDQSAMKKDEKAVRTTLPLSSDPTTSRYTVEAQQTQRTNEKNSILSCLTSSSWQLYTNDNGNTNTGWQKQIVNKILHWIRVNVIKPLFLLKQQQQQHLHQEGGLSNTIANDSLQNQEQEQEIMGMWVNRSRIAFTILGLYIAWKRRRRITKASQILGNAIMHPLREILDAIMAE